MRINFHQPAWKDVTVISLEIDGRELVNVPKALFERFENFPHDLQNQPITYWLEELVDLARAIERANEPSAYEPF